MKNKNVEWGTRLRKQNEIYSTTIHVFVKYLFCYVLWDSVPGGASGKEPACQCRRQKDAGLINGSGRSPGEANGNPLQCSCLENPMDMGASWGSVHRVIKSGTQLKWICTQHWWSHKESQRRGSWKYSLLYSQVLDRRDMTCHARPCGKTLQDQWAEDRIGVPQGKTKLCRGNSAGLASLNDFSEL